MDTQPYIRHGNCFFVPSIRQRLSFCLLVRETARVLRLGRADGIAIGLPPTIKDALVDSVRHLSNLQIRYLEVLSEQSTQCEVFPVTPNDAMIEGVRLASESSIPLHFVDLALDPAHLGRRRCEAQVRWPDDALALEHGAQWYMDLIQHHLEQPPMRDEPIDTWREQHIADQLRRLVPLHRQLLVIIDAQNVRGVRQCLRRPAPLESETHFRGPRLRTLVKKPNLKTTLSYLDDIPFVVESFERSRKNTVESSFDRADAILSAVHEVALQATDLHFATPRFRAFRDFLGNIIRGSVRAAPGIDTIVLAANGCFNTGFGERVRNQLLKYGKEIPVHRVGPSTNEDLYASIRELTQEEGLPHYVQRSCNPDPRTFAIVRGKRIDKRANGRPYMLTWPRWVWHFMDMVDRTHRVLARETKGSVRPEKFAGSIGLGIDVRRTLRSYFRGRGEFWVKQPRRTSRVIPRANDPIVFVFVVPAASPPGVELFEDYNHVAGDDHYAYAYRCSEFSRELETPSGVKVRYSSSVGLSLFADMRLTLSALRTKLGVDLDRRVPRYKATTCPPGDYSDGSWVDQLLIAALRHANEGIICVCPDGWVPPHDIRLRADAEGKTIHLARLSSFTADEQHKLRTLYYIVTWDLEEPKDSNDPDFNAEVVRRYEQEMKELW